MCLLDSVEAWDSTHIRCRACSHHDAGNPLRGHGRLGAASGIEYAAQAMAVHGALMAEPRAPRARSGYLVSVRGMRLHVTRLDDIASDLLIDASWITRSGDNVLYRFAIRAADRLLMDGRAAVVLDAGTLATPGEAS